MEPSRCVESLKHQPKPPSSRRAAAHVGEFHHRLSVLEIHHILHAPNSITPLRLPQNRIHRITGEAETNITSFKAPTEEKISGFLKRY